MKKLVAMLAMVAFVGSITGLVMAADTKPKIVTLKGTVVKVDGKVITMKMADTNKDRPLNTDDKTVVTIDGKDAKVADLQPGMKIEGTRPLGDSTPATKIVATTATTSAPASAPAK